jgi:hypothetical protein
MRPYSSQSQLNTLDEAALLYIARAHEWSVPSNGLINNPPNHISMVFQWRVFLILMAHLPRDREISWFPNHWQAVHPATTVATSVVTTSGATIAVTSSTGSAMYPLVTTVSAVAPISSPVVVPTIIPPTTEGCSVPRAVYSDPFGSRDIRVLRGEPGIEVHLVGSRSTSTTSPVALMPKNNTSNNKQYNNVMRNSREVKEFRIYSFLDLGCAQFFKIRGRKLWNSEYSFVNPLLMGSRDSFTQLPPVHHDILKLR